MENAPAWRRKFLNSRAWRTMRVFVIHRDNFTCAECGGLIIDSSPVVHHVIELTESNYTNPAISLNPALLETLHHDCHDARHKRFGGRVKTVIVDDELNIDYSKRGR